MRSLQFVLVCMVLWCLPSLADACQAIRKPVLDIQGNILIDVAVTITNTNGGATSTLYADALCTVITTNPVMTGVDGTFVVFVPDGVYTLTPVKVGYSFVTVTNVNVFEPMLENSVSVVEFSTTDLSATTTGAIDQIGATVTTLYITKPVSVITSKTAPATLSIVLTGKGDITVNAGQTFTVNGPVTNLTDHAVFIGTGTTTFGVGAGPNPYGKQGEVIVTYSASMAIDASLGTTFVITATNATAFTINTPTKPAHNRRIRINIRNSSGGALGAATFSGYKNGAAWTQPANGFNRSVYYEYSGSTWDEVSRSAADVTN